MSSNPMQRQARNSFLLGMLVTILVAAAVIAFLFLQMKKLKEENNSYIMNSKEVYVLNQDVKSGDVLTEEMFTTTTIIADSIPDDAIDISSVLDAYSLYTKDGVRIISGYIDGQQHLYLDEGKEINKNTEVFINQDTGEYYITNSNGAREYIEVATAPVIIKIAAKVNTIMTQAMIARSDEVTSNDTRKTEYNTVILPIDLAPGDYIDIRMMLPSGQNYVVLSKKRVDIPVVNGSYLADTIQMDLAEEEILAMSSAIVENWMMGGSSMLYATKYTEAGMQDKASITYVPNKETYDLMQTDPNIVNRAKTETLDRYAKLTDLRNNYINNAVSNYGSTEAISGQMDSSVSSTLEARQQYLQSLVAE